MFEGFFRGPDVTAGAPRRRFDLGTKRGRQEALNSLSFCAGAIDGDRGPKSKGALIAFQTAHDLVPDGSWGPRSEAAVRSALLDL
jgi:hypothetical protein